MAKALTEAAYAVTDALVWRVQLRSIFGSREAFLYQLEMSFAHALDDKTRSKLLLGHYKVVASYFPSAFLSQAKQDALQVGRCRKAKTKKVTTQAGTQTDFP